MRPACLLPVGLALAAALAGCGQPKPKPKPEADADAASSRSLKVESFDAPIPRAPLKGGKLEVLTPRFEAAAPAGSQPPAPAPADPHPAQAPPLVVRAPAGKIDADGRRDLYDGAPASAGQAPPADTPGFRVTLPVCRNAAAQGDPLAETPECREMMRVAEDQARLCAKAFQDGDDAVALSPACRQAARARSALGAPFRTKQAVG